MYDKGGDNPLGRLALHAKRLAFRHPKGGRKVDVTVEPPASFRDLQL
jgi:23S rRNA-/tRNA-specific pseudouridylate synthase